ncbi:MAG: hypothetical protein JWN17_2157 [Frankiales bacterium]|nr:hypothetical protein [Frankiales bacterium]
MVDQTEPGRRVASAAGPWSEVVRASRYVLSAPHAAAQVRDGTPKRAEEATRDLALQLSAQLGWSAIHTEPEQRGDPNWDEGSPYLERLAAWHDDVVVVDLHVMRPRGVDLCLGLGQEPERASRLYPGLVAAAVRSGYPLALNWPFSAGPRTITSQLQRRGREALQVEISYTCLDAERYDQTVAVLRDGLAAVVA